MKYKMGKILGRALSIFALLGSLLVDYTNLSLFKNTPTGFWSSLMLLGLFLFSAADASQLRHKYSDRSKLSIQDYFLALGISIAFVGWGLWLAK